MDAEKDISDINQQGRADAIIRMDRGILPGENHAKVIDTSSVC